MYSILQSLLPLQVRETILECTLELSTKTSMYATLAGKQSSLPLRMDAHKSIPYGPLRLSSHTVMRHVMLYCAGLLNADDSTFVEKLLEEATQRFGEALAAADKNSPRLLLRFFAALVPAYVLHPSSVLNALCSIVDAALEAAEAGEHLAV